MMIKTAEKSQCRLTGTTGCQDLKCRAQAAIDSNPQARDLCIFGSRPSLVSVAMGKIRADRHKIRLSYYVTNQIYRFAP